MKSDSETQRRFERDLEHKVKLVNKTLGRILSRRDLISKELRGPVRYVLMGPGKRIRSVIVLWCCEMISGRVNHDAEIAAAAIEMIHTYSLIHDDLPAMDDDDYRRGRLTCHKKFDEATAILAGDGLLTLAFEVLAKEIKNPARAALLVGELAEAAGPAGMVAGQMADLDFENKNVDEKILRYIHTNKTAKMFRCAAVMGGMCGGANEKQLKRMREYGLKIGLGFQIADDILDVCGTSKQLGKTSGKDAKQGKQTYPAVAGLARSRGLAKKTADDAVAALRPFGEKADMLRLLVEALLNRTK
ncbi:MAG: polyprenyl synthetase family protein [Sedimentisphaerales bacterium]|jgi:geranylgeranyl pyrophosphate synthase